MKRPPLLSFFAAMLATNTVFAALPVPLDGVDAESKPIMAGARRRIDEVRKGNFTLEIVDSRGQPINGPVEARMLRHHFQFGNNLTATFIHLRDRPVVLARALEVFAELYNFARVGDFWQFMQPSPEPRFDFSRADTAADWARARGLGTRYHCLVYNFHYAVPRWYDSVTTEAEWWTHIETLLRTVGQHYGDRLDEYDVINEMFTNLRWYEANNPRFPRLADPSVGARIFHLARQYLPRAKLVCLEAGSPSNPGYQRIYDYQKALLSLGAPVDVIGFQCHSHLIAMRELDAHLERLATFGKPVHITEYTSPFEPRQLVPLFPSREAALAAPADMDTSALMPDEAKAAYAVNSYTLMFSKPYIHQIDAWHFCDTRSGIIDRSGNKLPMYHALKKLLTQDWWTHWQGESRAGHAAFRGFYGTYEISVPGHQPLRVELTTQGKVSLTLAPL